MRCKPCGQYITADDELAIIHYRNKDWFAHKKHGIGGHI